MKRRGFIAAVAGLCLSPLGAMGLNWPVASTLTAVRKKPSPEDIVRMIRKRRRKMMREMTEQMNESFWGDAA
jgi:hypothetical protein